MNTAKTIKGIKFQIIQTADNRFAVFVQGIKRSVKPTLKGANGVIDKIVEGM